MMKNPTTWLRPEFQLTSSQHTSIRLLSIILSYLRLGLQRDIFPGYIPTKILYVLYFLVHTSRMICVLSILSLFDFNHHKQYYAKITSCEDTFLRCFPFTSYFTALWSKYLPQFIFLKSPSIYILPSKWETKSHLHSKQTAIITVRKIRGVLPMC